MAYYGTNSSLKTASRCGELRQLRNKASASTSSALPRAAPPWCCSQLGALVGKARSALQGEQRSTAMFVLTVRVRTIICADMSFQVDEVASTSPSL